MNIDLIIKLIKLANHNPNENEANSAARKVCSLLKDYTFTISTTSYQNQRQTNPRSDPSMDDIMEILKNMTREQQRRAPWTNPTEKPKTSTEYSQARQRREEEFYGPRYRGGWDWAYGDPLGKSPVTPETETKNREEPIYYSNMSEGKVYPKRALNCKECGTTKETTWPGDLKLFVCSSCQWEKYNASRT